MNTVAKYANAKFKTSMICFMIPPQFKIKQQGTIITVFQFPGLVLSNPARYTAKILKVFPPVKRIG
jgi:hypothetical protein